MRQLKIIKSFTNREADSLDKYLFDISKEELVSPNEEVELAQRIKKGDEHALKRLVKANLRFVVSVAKQYQNQGLSLPDLINEGNIGLIKAAERFDDTKGFKFISYAVWWIRQSILQAIAENSKTVRLPLNQIGSINKIKKAISKLEQICDRPPTPEEISSLTEISLKKVMYILEIMNGKSTSIDAATNEEDPESTYLHKEEDPDSLRPDEKMMLESLKKEIERSIAKLTEREAEIIRSFFGLNGQEMTLEEIGNRHNMTKERIRQIKEKAIKRLRHHTKNRLLKQYL